MPPAPPSLPPARTAESSATCGAAHETTRAVRRRAQTSCDDRGMRAGPHARTNPNTHNADCDAQTWAARPRHHAPSKADLARISQERLRHAV
eukprot:4867271-Pyramimonas_sp.AAC.1